MDFSVKLLGQLANVGLTLRILPCGCRTKSPVDNEREQRAPGCDRTVPCRHGVRDMCCTDQNVRSGIEQDDLLLALGRGEPEQSCVIACHSGTDDVDAAGCCCGRCQPRLRLVLHTGDHLAGCHGNKRRLHRAFESVALLRARRIVHLEGLARRVGRTLGSALRDRNRRLGI